MKDYTWKTLAERLASYGTQSLTRKAYKDVDLTVENGEIVAVVSTDGIDAENEIVLPKGVDFTRFRKQPGVYFEHDTDGLPLGPCLWIKATDHAIIAKYKITESASPLHKAVSELIKSGAYTGHSIGFVSENASAPTSGEVRTNPKWASVKTVHRKSTLLEFSVVGMPCNEDAIALAVSKGFKPDVIDFLTGKTMLTKKATADVIQAVKAEPAFTKYEMTTKDFNNLLAKKLGAAVDRIDTDKVIDSVRKALKF